MGKSTPLDEPERRGYRTIDTDYDERVTSEGGWDEDRKSDLLVRHSDVVVSGTVENQGRFYDRFDQVALLSAPVDVLNERVTTRANNPYGRSAEQRAGIRRDAPIKLDGQRPIVGLTDVVERLNATADP